MKLYSQWGGLFARTRGAGLTLAAGLVLAGSGCAVDSGAGDEALSSPAGGETALEDVELPVPFASFATDDGGTVQFFEPEPGELLVSSVSKVDSQAPVDRKSPAALYEELAGEPLPERFVAALAPADPAVEGEAVEPALADSGTPDFSGASDRRIEDFFSGGVYEGDVTTDQFVELYCTTGFDPLWCWLNRTGTTSFSQRLNRMGAVVYVYRGSVTHTLSRKNFWGNWKTLFSAAIPAGYRSSVFNDTNNKYTYESRVDDASGDGYHHSGFTM